MQPIGSDPDSRLLRSKRPSRIENTAAIHDRPASRHSSRSFVALVSLRRVLPARSVHTVRADRHVRPAAAHQAREINPVIT